MRRRISTYAKTVWILIATAILLIVWDIYVAYTPAPGDTISEILLTWAEKHPVLPFAFGALFGHLFWPQRIHEECAECAKKKAQCQREIDLPPGV